MKEMRRSGQAWLGDIPKEWDYVPLKAIFNRRTQKNNPIISTERLSLSIDKGITLYADKTTNLDRFKDDFTQYQLSYPGDIVLNCMNMIVGAIGLSRYFGCVSPVYYVIYPKNNAISVRFYNYLLNISSIKDLYRSLGQGIYAIDRGDGRVNTCRLKVSYDDFRKIEIPVPTFEEQHAIADFLDVKCAEVDELITLQEKMIEEFKVYKHSVITEVVTKGLNPDVPLKDSGIELIGLIPEHWNIERLKNRIKLNPSITATNIDSDTIVSFVPMECLRNAVITPKVALYSDVNTYTPFQEQDIVMAKVTPCYENGNIAIATNLDNGIGFGSSEIFVIRCNSNINNNYLFYYLQSTYAKNTGTASMTGTGGLKRVNPTGLCCSRLLCFPIEEQQQIANYLDKKCAEIDEMTSIKQQKIEQLKEYKKSIIYEYVTGKKQVNIE